MRRISTLLLMLSLVANLFADTALWPANVVLSKSPEQVRLLSMNNSLIHYENEWQDDIFNKMCAAMGRDAIWTAHTNLGKTLDYHYNEGEGLTDAGIPSARMLVRTNAYTHIILQEQTAKPRTNFTGFRESVQKWIKYIREEGANPNAQIIIPVNWAYNSDMANFTAFNAEFVNNYKLIAEEFGVTITPVGIAYQKIYEAEGTSGLNKMFKDDRHPTQQATYMAACMEYATIFGVDPTTITWHPSTITAEVAAKMRGYAKQAIEAYEQTVDQKTGTVRYSVHMLDVNGMSTGRVDATGFTVSGGGTMAGNVFTSNNTYGSFVASATYNGATLNANITVAEQKTVVVVTPSVSVNGQNKTLNQNFDSLPVTTGTPNNGKYAVENNKLPEGWRIDRNMVGPRTIGTFVSATEDLMYAGGENLPSNASNGTWNLGAVNSTDRAVGGMTTGVDNGTRAINVMVHLKNDGTTTFDSVDLEYDIEKYREGSNSNLFYVKLFTSKNGNVWTDAGDTFTYMNPKGSGQTGFAVVPGDVKHISGKLDCEFVAGTDLYLCWSISTSAGTDCSYAPCLAIDNVSMAFNELEKPVSDHYIYVDDQTGYEVLALYAYGDSELYGKWPGVYKQGDKDINGKTYRAFPLGITANGSYNLIFNNGNNGKQLPDFKITEARDYVLRLTASGVKEIDPNNPEPEYTFIELNATAPYTQDFNSLPYPAADAAVIDKGYVSAEPSKLPEGWRVERNEVGPRTIGSYADASESAQYQGGVSLPTSAANGTWNFGMNGDTDRAVGGMTTGVAGGARTINVMAAFTNADETAITSMDIAYDIEKYRDGSNANAFYVKLFTSEDGNAWTEAGDAFTYMNPVGSGQTGFATVPATTTNVSGTLTKTVEPGKMIYLCWSISTSAGDDCQAAPALAIDNVSIAPVFAEPAHYIYVDDQTGYETLCVYAWGTSELYGVWPGKQPTGEKEIDGTTYKVFPLNITDSGSYNLIFNNGNSTQIDDYNITEARDYRLKVTATGVTDLDSDTPDPVDPVDPVEPDYAAIELTANAASYTQDFNSLPCPAADAAVIEKGYVSAEPSQMPEGWRVERNEVGPRTIGSYANASETAQYQGGVSLPNNAANGTWNLGMNGDTDRAVGGMTTGVANGARTINVMAAFKNADTDPIAEVALSYDIEKYRDGSNANAFYVKLFTSADGVAWTEAGDTFTYMNPVGSGQTGFATVPAQTTTVNGKLSQGLEPGKWLYLCWSISTSAGDNCASAPCLAIDNVQLTAKFDMTSCIETRTETADGSVYSLQGIRMPKSAAAKGIYIQNGKKYAVK